MAGTNETENHSCKCSVSVSLPALIATQGGLFPTAGQATIGISYANGTVVQYKTKTVAHDKILWY